MYLSLHLFVYLFILLYFLFCGRGGGICSYISDVKLTYPEVVEG